MRKTTTAWAAAGLLIAAMAWGGDELVRLSAAARQSAQGVNPELPHAFPAALLKAPAAAASAALPYGNAAPWPTEEWSVSTPEAQGLDRHALTAAFAYAVQHQSRAVLVIRNGYIVGEWYAPGWNASRWQSGYSIAKSVTSALVGMLLDDGVIASLDQKVADFIPEWRDGTHDAVTVRHLVSMTSGLAWDAVSDVAVLTRQPDQNRYAITRPMEAAPGTEWIYHNTAVQVLSQLILNATGQQPAEYARERLGPKLGIRRAAWVTDEVGNTLTYQSVVLSARDFAKFGYLFLRGGEWDGEQLISRQWVEESTARPSQELNPFYGHLWWVNAGGLQWPDAPADAYAALGLFERKLYVIPSLDMVGVRLGDSAPQWSDNEFLGLVSDSVLPPTVSIRTFGYAGTVPVVGDFDGDGRSDYGCYDAAAGAWNLMQSAEGLRTQSFGYAGAVPAVGDFDGDGKADLGCYDAAAGAWNLMQSERGFRSESFGFAGTVPVIGDFDGDGKSDFGCYDPKGGNWYLMQSADGFKTFQFGYGATVPVVEDFDGDRKSDPGCYDASAGAWYFMQSRDGFRTEALGYAGTVPVVGDFDGNESSDYGCFNPAKGEWLLTQGADALLAHQFGYGAPSAVVGDFNGDHEADVGCYYAAEGLWYILQKPLPVPVRK